MRVATARTRSTDSVRDNARRGFSDAVIAEIMADPPRRRLTFT